MHLDQRKWQKEQYASWARIKKQRQQIDGAESARSEQGERQHSAHGSKFDAHTNPISDTKPPVSDANTIGLRQPEIGAANSP
jgi:hypothetical protein